MGLEKGLFQRTELLLGENLMNKISSKNVIIFGTGGVGSWCAESLVRSGIRRLTIVDSDRICMTNINRQIMATVETIGQVKVEALKSRLLSINPNAQITAIQAIYNKTTFDSFKIGNYDYILDCIDSLENKVLLILEATKTDAKFFSSMGAALKCDFTQIRMSEFWKINGCALAAAVRKRMRRNKTFPSKKFTCLYSPEILENKGKSQSCGTEKCLCPKSTMSIGSHELTNHEWCSQKAQINGTIAHTTAIFGFAMAGMVINDMSEITGNE
ncbi:MAG: tRNA threonylcarbamoyladenosine dehydratase [Prevotellaceae bacterium]|jgi:tRNA A37 threonylcarbamoyladenosine dehydratase|nr:tRNA threonylcarbamoyladenosine dehydratase [Prevotellaceae bacterium]